ncbi:MAG: glutaminyl-peptide cyclotransferase [Pseudomonadota bacterium]|nr:glutaminyl-peptide cyclotransferase [Pseudomonadota bacterium]
MLTAKYYLWAILLVVWIPDMLADSVSRQYGFSVVKVYPHDPQAFTQGLIFEHGRLYESTGLNGHSSLREIELETGKILRIKNLAPEHFGEGLTLHKGKLYQLTWQSGVGFVYDFNSFEYLEPFAYRYGEGKLNPWGLTDNGKELILSDGSSMIYFIDPITHRETRRIIVTRESLEIGKINELEYIKNEIFANIWQTDLIIRVDPETGEVIGEIDLSKLYPEKKSNNQVLNGIAYDRDQDRLFVTGKKWSKLFEIKLHDLSAINKKSVKYQSQ